MWFSRKVYFSVIEVYYLMGWAHRVNYGKRISGPQVCIPAGWPRMSEKPKIVIELMQGQPTVWHRWCERVNDETAPPLLAELLPQLTREAAHLLAYLEKKKAEGAGKKQIKALRETQLPRLAIRKVIANSGGRYPLEAKVQFDAKRGKMMSSQAHRYHASMDQLIGFGMGVAVASGDWRNFRQCKHVYCDLFFYQHSETGGKVRRYCTPSHRVSHYEYLKRHGEDI